MSPRKPERAIRYAVVGTGHIAQVAVLPAFKSAANSKLVAVVSGDPEKQKALSRQYRLEQVYSYDQYDHALSEVDAVYIAVPNHLHREYAVRAAQAGVHVLCEKPMAVTEDECQAMIDAAETNNVRLMIAYRLHFEKGNLEAIRIAHEGRLGELRFFSSSFGQQVVEDNVRMTTSVAQGGGPLYDMGVYCINAARYLFRSEPVEVLAMSATQDKERFEQVEEMTSAMMRFPGERIATFTCSFGSADVSRFDLIGSKGVLTADPAYGYAEETRHELTVDGKTTRAVFPRRDQFAAELVYFSDCVLNNKKPEPSGEEGLADVRILQAIYLSARSGSLVQVPALPKKPKPSMRQEIHRPAHGKPKVVNVKSPSGDAA
jgi:predicted dehydrogenase